MEFGNYSRSRLAYIGIEHAFLLQIVGHGVLGQERCLEPDLGSDPFAFAVRSAWRMVAASAAAELRAKVGALNLIELLNFLPGGVAHGAGNVDLKMQDAHDASVPHRDDHEPTAQRVYARLPGGGVRAYTSIA